MQPNRTESAGNQMDRHVRLPYFANANIDEAIMDSADIERELDEFGKRQLSELEILRTVIRIQRKSQDITRLLKEIKKGGRDE